MPPAPVDAVSIDADSGLTFTNEADDDRDEAKPGDDVLLIVENDLGFAKVLLDSGRRQGFKGIVAGSGAAALAMMREYDVSVLTLDIFLPDMQGWRVLDRMKADLTTRHIPVCVVSTDDSRDRALGSGAIGFIGKPLTSQDSVDQAIRGLHDYLTRAKRRVVLLMPGGVERQEIAARLTAADMDVMVRGRRRPGLPHARQRKRVDCLVVHENEYGLRAESVLEALEGRAVTQQLPVVLYGSDESGSVLARWRRNDGILALREARSRERLLDYVYFFLHRNAASMAHEERQTPRGPA